MCCTKVLEHIFGGLWLEMGPCQKIQFLMKNRISNKLAVVGQRNKIEIKKDTCASHEECRITGCRFLFDGTGHVISIDRGARIYNVSFEMIGSGNRIVIGKGVVLRNSLIHVGDMGSKLIIKDEVDVGNDAKWTVLEGTRVEIGKGCMFSTNSHIQSSDSHSIIDLADRVRTNLAANIKIGRDVWFGEDVTCLKGVTIEDGAIFGSKCLVSGGGYEGNAIYVGIPCKKIRGNVQWKRERIGKA